METNLFVTRISVEEMLNRSEKSYNPKEWERKVNSYALLPKAQFYVAEKNDAYQYARFYISYIFNGIYFFSEFHGFMSSLSSNGFCKVQISSDGEVYKSLFASKDGKEVYAENCEANRELFRKHLTPLGVMVSNCL